MFYSALEVTRKADGDEIKASYRRLALKYHPDKNGGQTNEKFQEIQRAYEVLGDPQKRAAYDKASTQVRTRMKGFVRPPPFAAPPRKPFTYRLADRTMYVFESASDRVKCRLTCGDLITFGSGSAQVGGVFFGIAADDFLYWCKDGTDYAQRLCHSGSDMALSNVRVVQRTNLGLHSAARPAAAGPRTSRTGARGGGSGGASAKDLFAALRRREEAHSVKARLKRVDLDESEDRAELEEECLAALGELYASITLTRRSLERRLPMDRCVWTFMGYDTPPKVAVASPSGTAKVEVRLSSSSRELRPGMHEFVSPRASLLADSEHCRTPPLRSPARNSTHAGFPVMAGLTAEREPPRAPVAETADPPRLTREAVTAVHGHTGSGRTPLGQGGSGRAGDEDRGRASSGSTRSGSRWSSTASGSLSSRDGDSSEDDEALGVLVRSEALPPATPVERAAAEASVPARLEKNPLPAPAEGTSRSLSAMAPPSTATDPVAFTTATQVPQVARVEPTQCSPSLPTPGAEGGPPSLPDGPLHAAADPLSLTGRTTPRPAPTTTSTVTPACASPLQPLTSVRVANNGSVGVGGLSPLPAAAPAAAPRPMADVEEMSGERGGEAGVGASAHPQPPGSAGLGEVGASPRPPLHSLSGVAEGPQVGSSPSAQRPPTPPPPSHPQPPPQGQEPPPEQKQQQHPRLGTAAATGSPMGSRMTVTNTTLPPSKASSPYTAALPRLSGERAAEVGEAPCEEESGAGGDSGGGNLASSPPGTTPARRMTGRKAPRYMGATQSAIKRVLSSQDGDLVLGTTPRTDSLAGSSAAASPRIRNGSAVEANARARYDSLTADELFAEEEDFMRSFTQQKKRSVKK